MWLLTCKWIFGNICVAMSFVDESPSDRNPLELHSEELDDEHRESDRICGNLSQRGEIFAIFIVFLQALNKPMWFLQFHSSWNEPKTPNETPFSALSQNLAKLHNTTNQNCIVYKAIGWKGKRFLKTYLWLLFMCFNEVPRLPAFDHLWFQIDTNRLLVNSIIMRL